MSRLYTMARFEEHPAVPGPPSPEQPEGAAQIRRPRREHYVVDTPEQVSACLRCSKPECTNCLNRRRGKPRALPSKGIRRARCKKTDKTGFDREPGDT